MTKLLSVLLLALINILPNSPFQTTVDGEIYKLEFLPYLNWFIPFDNCLKITRAWLLCIIAYYIFTMTKKTMFNFFLNKIFK